MEKIKEKIIIIALSILSFLFFFNSKLTAKMFLYPLDTTLFSQISFFNFGLGTLFLCILIAIIGYGSLKEFDNISQALAGFLVFALSFILIGINNILYGFVLSVCFGVCFFLFSKNIQKEKEEYRQINKMRAFILVKSNIHKTFILIGFLCAFFAALMIFNTADIGENAINKAFSFSGNDSGTGNILDMAAEMQKNSTLQAAETVNLMIIEYIYEDDSLNEETKNTCIDVVNKSKTNVAKKLSNTYSQINLDDISIPDEQNNMMDKANKMIEMMKTYYFAIAGFIVFSIIALYGSIVGLISALMGILFYKNENLIDEQNEQ